MEDTANIRAARIGAIAVRRNGSAKIGEDKLCASGRSLPDVYLSVDRAVRRKRSCEKSVFELIVLQKRKRL